MEVGTIQGLPNSLGSTMTTCAADPDDTYCHNLGCSLRTSAVPFSRIGELAISWSGRIVPTCQPRMP
jgi:hypothetical protein